MRARKMPKRVRTPNCTHLNMDRIYGRDQQCYVCGREPSIGFLYECKQDFGIQTLHDILEQDDDCQIEVLKSKTRLQLEWAGLSTSIILTAEKGHYTAEQLEKLKAQKQELRQVISDQLQASHINNAAARLADMASAPPSSDGALGCSPSNETEPSACTFKACHSCRPYYRDRVYISFQSVLSLDFPPMTREDTQHLPIKSAKIMSSVGTVGQLIPSLPMEGSTTLSMPTSMSLGSTDAPPTASTSTSTTSDLTFKTTKTDLDEIHAQHHPRRRFYKMGHRISGDISRDLSRQSTLLTRQGLKNAFQGIFRSTRESSSEGSNITLPLPRTGTVRDSNSLHDIGDFDLPALRKVRRQKERNEVKNGIYVTGFEGVQAVPLTTSHQTYGVHEASSGSETDLSMYSCASEGSEVEVNGGVALTEEAVKTHTPDILAVDMTAARDAVLYQDVDMSDDDEAEADIGLQSIMTQV
ncbi:hypothetical protein BKA63DRAFT_116670 [Paraphoma chrysanthemicola]|nr:hypothetical protein BKA63DRAFT_116670 [Paraphoma chrysanthemicola]